MASLRFLLKHGGGGSNYGHGTGGAALEVTVLSAESLRLPPSYSPLPRRLRPYITVSSDASSAADDSDCYSTAVASSSTSGGTDHTWAGNDTVVVVPVGPDFLAGRADVHVSVMSEPSCRLVGGATLLGWCAVPAADVLDGLRAPRARRRLSYALRSPRRTGGDAAVVHLAVRVLGLDDARHGPAAPVVAPPVVTAAPAPAQQQQQGWCRVAMGIPVTGASAAAAVVGTPWPWR